jgi:hypothetical protein
VCEPLNRFNRELPKICVIAFCGDHRSAKLAVRGNKTRVRQFAENGIRMAAVDEKFDFCIAEM